MFCSQKEQRQDKFERTTTWATVSVDVETATATKIPTARGQAMVKGMMVYRHKGQVLRWEVGLAKAKGFATGVK